jgi:hypothetical protein
MPFTPTPPTHHCAVCGKALWDNTWPYAACKACGQKPCRHGNKPSDCGQCDAEGDRAYDAAKGN